jgi:hypothetical protein
MVVVPVDAEEDEAEHVGAQFCRQRRQPRPIVTFGRLKLEHHDGDQNCNDAVAERFEPPFAHGWPLILSGMRQFPA